MDKKLADKLAQLKAKAPEPSKKKAKKEEVEEEPEEEEEEEEETEDSEEETTEEPKKEEKPSTSQVQLEIERLQNDGIFRAELLYQLQVLNAILSKAWISEEEKEE